MSKYLRVTMTDGSEWDVPIDIIAKNAAEYYAEYHNDEFDSVDSALQMIIDWWCSDDYEIIDWAANNMNWSDVKDHAEKVKEVVIDWQVDGWINGNKEIIEK